MTKSLQMIDPIVVSFFKALEVIIAFTIQIIGMHQFPNNFVIIGAILVLLSVILISIQDFLVKKGAK